MNATSTSGSSPETPVPGTPTRGDPEIAGAEDPAAPPMAPMQLGRWFALPLLIIVGIVGGAVLVVFLFGAPASQDSRSVEELLGALEASGGEKRMGMLLPREKELWQTGLELTLRLRQTPEKEFGALSESELKSAASRLGAMVREAISDSGFQEQHVSASDSSTARAPTRLEFLIRSLGLTQQPEAIGPLITVVRSGNDRYGSLAMQQLGNLASLEETRTAIDPMLELLRSSTQPEAKLIACTALSVIAVPGDEHVIEQIKDVRSSSEGEVAWSAALALARLGSAAGKSTLLDLLDRPFWEKGDRYRATDAAGGVVRRPMPPGRIEKLLIAVIEAVSNLDDPDLWEGVERLKSDRSPRVRAAAAEATAGRSG